MVIKNLVWKEKRKKDIFNRRYKMDKTILRFLTAGSVDDGKSSFLGRLLFDSNVVCEDHLQEVKKLSKDAKQDFTDLSLLIDGLESERSQKITIDAAYRYFTTNKRKFIIADAPGHEEYTRNMAVAASNSDVAVILIDAVNGVRKQSIRHSYIAHLFGIKHFIVAINKMDLVNYDQNIFEQILADFKERTEGFLADIKLDFVPISALKGDNVVTKTKQTSWYKGKTVIDLLENIEVNHYVANDNSRLMVQYVSKYNNKRYLQGRLSSGKLVAGQEIRIFPGDKAAKIEEIIHSTQVANKVSAGNSVAVLLDKEIDVERGSIITNNNPIYYENKFLANIIWFKDGNTQYDESVEYIIKLNHNLVNSRISKLNYIIDINNLAKNNKDQLQQNDIANVTINLARKLPFDFFNKAKFSGSFLIIDKLSNATIACGMIDALASSNNIKLSEQEKYHNFVKDVLKAAKKHFNVDAADIFN
jgi:sulfate adenylyltransferase subunit 1